mgnify:CR=1 FL=1
MLLSKTEKKKFYQTLLFWEILIGALEQLYDVLGETAWDPEHFTRLFRLLLSQYHVAFGVDMREGYQTVTDGQGYLTRVTDENGSDVYLFIYH